MPEIQGATASPKDRDRWVLDCLLIAVCATILIWPIFKTKYYENWMTIDSTFIADARFLSENLPHPGWNHLWYGGTRWDYIYPPALRYGSALLSKAFGLIPARGYHLYTALFYASGIVFVYLFARIGSGVRYYAIFSAACVAFLSPSYLFLADSRLDTQPFMPQRLNVLVRYGEGPHMSAFALLPLGLALSWYGLRKGEWRWLAGASLVFAGVVSNNFYGAAALAMFFPVLCWAVFCHNRDPWLWLRAAVIALLSWGLCASWLTPTYLRITSRNLALVSQPGHRWSVVLLTVLLLAFGVWAWRGARAGWSAWTIFAVGAAMIFSVNVLGHYYFDFRVSGEPSRLVPELDLCLILLLAWLGYHAWQRWPRPTPRRILIGILVLCCVPARMYFAAPWHHLTRTSEYKHRKEYQIAEWVNTNRPGTRSYVTGTLRFWWNAWFDGEQIGGGSEQGLSNFTITPFFWQSVYSEDPRIDILWLQAWGVDNVAANDQTSKLPLVDYVHPHKFQGVLKTLWEDGEGNWIYEVPRKHSGLARVVAASGYAALREPQSGDDEGALRPYVDLLERSSSNVASTRWLKPDTLEVRAQTADGEGIAVQVAYDDYWKARENGKEYPISRDPFGQMRIDVPPGSHHLTLHFDTPIENTAGRYATGATFAAIVFLLTRRRPRPSSETV